MKIAKVILRVIGLISIILAGLGLWYNSKTLFADYSDVFTDRSIPYFYPAFYTMSAICIICYVVLIIIGIQFLRLRTGLRRIFAGVLIFEFIYFFSLGFLWLPPDIGRSIGAATGVANGGLMLQAFILFPLWAPFAVGWAGRNIEKGIEQSVPAYVAQGAPSAEP